MYVCISVCMCAFCKTIIPDLSSGNVTTFAGSTKGFDDGLGAAAKFDAPLSITCDTATGDLYVADYFNHRIRKITSSGDYWF